MKKAGIVIVLYLGIMLLQAKAQQAVPPPDLREADVSFSKREWRIIDLRERVNKTAAWPKNPLTKILYEAVRTGQLKPYRSDSLKTYYNIETFMKLGYE